ncbi:hypothetical protein N7456_007422 [Penicillium angulare]|uniref:Uncharacterized protein n=1 Tax=Penicillium angulare TaxID=116970 RepID=A0A9W9FAR5_9EURO|nr:hypothetical protein N7456_007422 [Penicillium angulare]
MSRPKSRMAIISTRRAITFPINLFQFPLVAATLFQLGWDGWSRGGGMMMKGERQDGSDVLIYSKPWDRIDSRLSLDRATVTRGKALFTHAMKALEFLHQIPIALLLAAGFDQKVV